MKKVLFSIFALTLGLNSFGQGWFQVNDLPGSARHHPCFFTVDDTAYCLTGVTNSGQMLNDFYRYDESNDTWISLTDFSGANRGFAVGLNHQGKGYVGFGVAGNNSVLRDLWEFDPQSKAWTSLASLPSVARYHPAFVAKDGKIYVGLGSSGSSNLNDWWEYDIAGDSWSRKANFPGDRRHHPYYFVAGNEIFVGLGHGNTTSGVNLIYDDWYKYEPLTDTWTKMGDFPGYARVAGAHFAYNGKGYIVGGQNQTHSTPTNNEVWSYTPGTDSWTQLPDCPSGGRWAPGSFVLGNNAYFAFGEDINGISQADIYQVSMSDIISIEEDLNAKDLEISIFPNPANAEINIEIGQKELGGNITVEFYSLSGQLLKVNHLENGETKINIEELASGIYTLNIKDEKDLNQSYILSVD